MNGDTYGVMIIHSAKRLRGLIPRGDASTWKNLYEIAAMAAPVFLLTWWWAIVCCGRLTFDEH